VLDRFLPEETVSTQTSQWSFTPEADDVAAALARLAEISDGDAEFAAELIDAFVVSGGEALDALREGLSLDDAVAVKQSAHKLKGAASNLHLMSLAEIASRIEANSEDARGCERDVATIDAQFRRVVASLQRSTEMASRQDIATRKLG
jgi:HPt (histidine-containing phosphotransfer) domain-containing protein